LKIPHPRAFVKFTWKTEVSRQEPVATRQPTAASRHPVKEIARDAVRAEIDTRLATEVLGFPPEVMAPDGPLALPQQKLALEPFITGSKSVSSTGEIKRHPEVERPPGNQRRPHRGTEESLNLASRRADLASRALPLNKTLLCCALPDSHKSGAKERIGER
jgi:hypothetical protein